MDDFSKALSALAGQEVIEATEVAHNIGNNDWFPARFSHRHPAKKLLVFRLLSDDTHGLFCWVKDPGYPYIARSREAAVKIRPHEIRINGSVYHFEATELKLKP